MSPAEAKRRRRREREKVARQRGAKIRKQPHVERQLNFHFTEGKVNHLDIFAPMQREIISEQLLIDNAADREYIFGTGF